MKAGPAAHDLGRNVTLLQPLRRLDEEIGQARRRPRPDLAASLPIAVFGELARKEPATQPLARAFAIPWGRVSLALLLAVVLLAYAIKLVRRLSGSSHVAVYRAVLDRLSDVGAVRHYGESRERHAARLARQAPSFERLTTAHLRLALRGADEKTKSEFDTLARATRAELRANTPWLLRARAFFNPIGWWFTR